MYFRCSQYISMLSPLYLHNITMKNMAVAVQSTSAISIQGDSEE